MGNAPSWSILYRTIPGYHNSIFFPTHFWYWWWWVIMTSQLYFFSYHNELLCRTINCYFWGNCNKDVKYILLLKNITLKPLSLLQRWIIVLCNCNPIQTVGVGGGRGGDVVVVQNLLSYDHQTFQKKKMTENILKSS